MNRLKINTNYSCDSTLSVETNIRLLYKEDRKKVKSSLHWKSTVSYDVGRLTQEELNRKYSKFLYALEKGVSLIVFLQELKRSIEYFRPVNISKEEEKENAWQELTRI